jgi:NTP pyrophosphatase (non-canonical NTP hydrolase)
MKQYIKEAMRTEPDYGPVQIRLVKDPNLVRVLHVAMGLSTESGELLDALKKHIFYGAPLDKVNLEEEMGDLFWYLAILADFLGFRSFTRPQLRNIAKLKKRYPNKFTEQEAQVRDLEAEREVLESGPRTATEAQKAFNSGWVIVRDTQFPAADYRQYEVQFWHSGKLIAMRTVRRTLRAGGANMDEAVEAAKLEMTPFLKQEGLLE